MNDAGNYTKVLVKEVIKAINKKVNDAAFDRTVKCTVTKVLTGNQYEVMKNNNFYIVPSHFLHKKDDVVFVLLPQNSWSDARIIY